mmetsp:Transcript_9448/g.19369  ORF Transcript_9448/g.19369 Transcript_9448/m.19369 type:complete len:99 (+) Transcript_9448:439-735(+)
MDTNQGRLLLSDWILPIMIHGIAGVAYPYARSSSTKMVYDGQRRIFTTRRENHYQQQDRLAICFDTDELDAHGCREVWRMNRVKHQFSPQGGIASIVK